MIVYEIQGKHYVYIKNDVEHEKIRISEVIKKIAANHPLQAEVKVWKITAGVFDSVYSKRNGTILQTITVEDLINQYK